MKLHTSSHCLMVETGRYSRPKIKRENRICTLCNTKEVEDERHLIFHCNAYSELRKTFFDKIHSIVQRNQNDIICTLCNTKEVEDERHLIFHCNAYSELRKTFFDKIHSIVQRNQNDENSFIKTIFLQKMQ